MLTFKELLAYAPNDSLSVILSNSVPLYALVYQDKVYLFPANGSNDFMDTSTIDEKTLETNVLTSVYTTLNEGTDSFNPLTAENVPARVIDMFTIDGVEEILKISADEIALMENKFSVVDLEGNTYYTPESILKDVPEEIPVYLEGNAGEGSILAYKGNIFMFPSEEIVDIKEVFDSPKEYLEHIEEIYESLITKKSIDQDDLDDVAEWNVGFTVTEEQAAY